MKTFEEAQAVLAQSLPGYETRPEQERFAHHVERTLAANEEFIANQTGLPLHAFAQAGTGTGKALGYLIPAVLSGHRTIVSVTTKALQSQLENLDLPFLQQHLGIDFSWTVLKGRSNYVCLNRMALADESEVPNLAALVREASAKDFGGERTDFSVEITDLQWRLICSETEECKDCGTDEALGRCFANEARVRAQESKIVVVNHALLASTLMIEAETDGIVTMLGEYDVVVIDEAHEFADVCSNSIGGRLSLGSVRHLNRQIQSWASKFAEEGDSEFIAPLGALTATAEDLFAALPDSSDHDPVKITIDHIESAVDQMSAFYEAMSRMGRLLAEAKVSADADYVVAKKRRDRIVASANSLHKRFLQIVSADFTEIVRWVEYDRRTNPTTGGTEWVKVVAIAPISVAPFLSENLYAKHPTVMVSATLSVKGKFDFAARQLGVEHYVELDVGTPFDYGTQARIYTPSLPDPKAAGPAWESAVIEEIVDLTKAANGRTLILFTSVAHMRRVKSALSRRLSGMTIKMQGEESVADLSRWFSRSPETGEKSVLLGVKSFFTGFDIRGEALTSVIIVKMPFPVPSEPLFAARCEKVKAEGGNDFSDLTLPMMSLVFQQAAGRLIRSKADRGVITILDPRISTKGYGRQIIKDLPPAPVITAPTQVEEFFGEVAEHFGFAPEESSAPTALSL